MMRINTTDFVLIDQLFEMNDGYVLDFSNRTFSQFFLELNVNIDDQRFNQEGGSKAKRLRYFLKHSDPATAVRALKALWKHREAIKANSQAVETVQDARRRFSALIGRLEGKQPSSDGDRQQRELPDPKTVASLRTTLLEMNRIIPQHRGYQFEEFLKKLFDSFGLEAREPFRVRGEQIDGSFAMGGDTYLLEAKWQAGSVGAADLHVLQGKIQEKAAWARGLFVSYSGFSPDGIHAFGRGKSVICMDGFDISQVLDRSLSLTRVLQAKSRRAAETGEIMVRVSELFP